MNVVSTENAIFTPMLLAMYLFQEVEKPEMGFANHKYSYGHDECP